MLIFDKNCKEFKKISSTNDFIKKNIENLPNGSLIFSTNQTAGYGKRGRSWVNFENENLAVSVLFKNIDSYFLKISTTLACVCAIKTLNYLGIENVKIKWFNDLTISNKKIAGILGESQIFGNKLNCILGLGINLLQQPIKFKQFNLPYAGSVLSQTQKTIPPKLFIKNYVKILNYFIKKLTTNKFQTIAQIQNIYLSNCCTINQKLKITNNLNNNYFFGTAKQILKNGNLLIETTNKNLIKIDSSQFSIVQQK